MAQLWSVQDRTRIQKGLRDYSSQCAPLHGKLEAKGRVKKRKRIKNFEIPVKFQTGVRPDRSYGRGTKVAGGESVEAEKFMFTNGRAYWSESVFLLDEEENPIDGDHLLSVEKEARADLMRGAAHRFNALLRTGDGGADAEGVGRLPIGLNTWFGTSLGTIGGISQTANPGAAHGIIDVSSDGPNSDVDDDLLWAFGEGIERATRRDGQMAQKPDLILTTPTIWNYLKLLYDSGRHQFRNQGATPAALFGTGDKVMVNGIEVVVDETCPAGRIDILSTDSLCLEYATNELWTVAEIDEPGALLGDKTLTARANFSFYPEDPARNCVLHSAAVSY